MLVAKNSLEEKMKKKVCICLDDGLKRQINFAKSLDIPISFSISTKNIGKDKFMNWEDVKKLSQNYEILCHGHDHNAWANENFDVENDIITALKTFHTNGIFPKGFVPPRNEWVETPCVRENFSYGRKGDGQLIPDLLRIKACGLSRLKLSDIEYAYKFNEPRNWAVYVAHLYKEENEPNEIFGDEYKVTRQLVEYFKKLGASFVTLEEIANEYSKEISAVYTKCQICGSENFEDFVTRKNARCSSCKSLERHRDLAWLIDEGIIDVQGKRCLCISSGELLPVLKRNGAEVKLISKFQKEPYNDVHDLSACTNYDCAFLQHVLPFVDNPELAIQSICKALNNDGTIYLQHSVYKNLSQHKLRENGYGYNFSENQFIKMIESLNLIMKQYPILPFPVDFMFEIKKKF